MKIAILFVVTALLGFASCDTVCISLNLMPCYAGVAVRHFMELICSVKNEMIACLKNAARECGMENAPSVEDVVAIYTETCEEGTEMNKLYEKHKICVYRTAATGNGLCMQPVMREIIGLGSPGQTREHRKRVLKVACKYNDSGNKCMDDNTNSTCGAEAAAFRHHFTDPSNRLANLACEEIGGETNDIHNIDGDRHHQDHSFHAIAPHIPAIGAHAGIIHIAPTVASREFHVDVSAATINISSHLVYILLATVFMKWFSNYC